MNLKLTPGGKDLLLRNVAGEVAINFCAIQFGNGADAGESAAELSNPLMTAEVASYEVGDVFVTLTSVFSNSEVAAGFRATEIGVLADDPDKEGGTLLYAYGYTPDAEADYIPASSDKVLETQMDVMVYIGDAENVTASISQSLVYVGKKEFEEFAERRDNPHHVTAEQVELGNVPNVKTNDQTPTYTEASNLAALVSGEKLSVAFGKIAKAVSSLIAHIGAVGKNIHKETPASIGAAPQSHKHSTNDITSGVLGLSRGGIGVTSYDALGEKLGIKEIAKKVQNTYPMEDSLSAETKEALGLEETAVPDDAFSLLKTLADHAVKIRSGSYVGTGAFGAGAPTRLEFDGKPMVLFIMPQDYTARYGCYQLMALRGVTRPQTWFYNHETTLDTFAHMTWYEQAVEFYSSVEDGNAGADIQLNADGVTYLWTALF